MPAGHPPHEWTGDLTVSAFRCPPPTRPCRGASPDTSPGKAIFDGHFQLKNLSDIKTKALPHRSFNVARPSGVVITDGFEKRVHLREWFYVQPEHMAEAIQLIASGMPREYQYDPPVPRTMPG